MHALSPFDIQKLPRDVDALLGVIDQLHTQYSSILASLHQQLQTLRRLHFGAKSEKLTGQPELFGEVLDLPTPPVEQIEVKYKRARRGRPALPEHLPRERIEYDLTDEQKAAFDSVERIGEEVSQTLEYTPAKLKVIEHARLKYACRKDGHSTIRTAHAEPSPLPKSNAGASVIAQILVATFVDHMPLYRQERAWAREGVAFPRSTLCEYKLGGAELLAVLRPALIAHVLAAPRVHADDTTLPLLEGGRGKTRTARLWGYLGAGARRDAVGSWVEHAPAVVFEFTESRESVHPARFLKGYRGYLQADAYAGFDALYQGGAIVEVGCWAHCRRKFFEVAKAQKSPGLAADAVAWIGQLYRIESSIRGSPPDQKFAVRQQEAVPLLDEFRRWLQGHFPSLLPQSPLGQAFGYALRNWDALVRYTQDGVLVPDNNLLESAIRPIAMGRKAFLFVAAERAGHAAATMYSLIGTCRLNGIEPYAYLKDVLRRLPAQPMTRLAELLPFHWQPAA
ncbi:MAG: IS66 family transposase [Burkholderiales bacterium]|nr:IS66 family transposase [Burkholderiales bacterium]